MQGGWQLLCRRAVVQKDLRHTRSKIYTWISKFGLMGGRMGMIRTGSACIAAVLVLSGCMDAGAVLGEASGMYAFCTLDKGGQCKESAPIGTRVEKATYERLDDAIRVLAVLKTTDECESFAPHARSRSPKHVSQVMINNIVVLPFGEARPAWVCLASLQLSASSTRDAIGSSA